MGTLPLVEDFNFLPVLEEFWEWHYAFQCWWSSLNHCPLYQHFRENIQPSVAMHFFTFCIISLFLDSYITLWIKGGNVGHLILNGLVWKSNRQKESKRPWDVEPNGQNMYYKCISLVNKKCILMFYPSYSFASHVCLILTTLWNLTQHI